MRGGGGLFACVQLELGFLLGPEDGRYLMRDAPGEDPRRVVVLRTLGAPQRRLLGRRRRARRVKVRGGEAGAGAGGGEVQPAPVPTQRATLIRAEPLPSREEAEAWLAALRGDRERAEREVADAERDLNLLLRAHRAAAGDPYAAFVAAPHALAVRLGYGTGDQVAEGRLAEALELPRDPRRRRGGGRRARLAPQERLAAILSARDELLAGEELVLRARADLDAGRPREAALQARVALEALLAELPPGALGPGPGGDEELAALRASRERIGEAANAALAGDPPDPLHTAVAEAVERMERALARRRVYDAREGS